MKPFAFLESITVPDRKQTLLRLESHFLKNCVVKGIICQDELKLGINADAETYQAIDRNGKLYKNLFIIGNTLKGVLRETTAVNELRKQAEQLAETILKNV